MLNNEIIQRLQENAFARSTFSQLQKDFFRVGIELALPDEVLENPQEFLEYLTKEVELVMNDAPHLMSQLLYITDLPESQVNQLFEEAEQPQRSLSEALLKRAAQKILYREKYKLGSL
ncbi:MAG: hypothetical protein ACQERC_01265 [Bacteroidota bacterium]